MALWVTLAACSSVPSGAQEFHEGKSSVERFEVESSVEWFLRDVATRGVDRASKIRDARIVLSPSTEVIDGMRRPRIPESFSDAVEEIEKSLPNWYLQQLDWKESDVYEGDPDLVCASDDLILDEKIIQWMIYYWRLEKWSPGLSLVDSDPKWHASDVANLVFNELCKERPPGHSEN